MTQTANPTTNETTNGAVAEAQPRIAELEQRLADLESRLTREVDSLREDLPEHRATLVLFSDDLDKALAGMVIATGAAALGMAVSVFVTFWGLGVIKKGRRLEKKSLMESMISLLNPGSSVDLQPSKMAYWGLGSQLLRAEMAKKGISTLEEMIALAQELGVTFTACEMSMDVMGIRHDELMDGVQVGGVAAYLGDAARSKVTLFI
jgi:peroxiredoxin family protein